MNLPHPARLILFFLFLSAAPLFGQVPSVFYRGQEVIDEEILLRLRTPDNAALSRVQSVVPSAALAAASPSLGLYVIHAPGQGVANLLLRFSAHPDVLYAEPNYVVHAISTYPNDPAYSSLWGMPQISAPAAWDITTGGTGAVVGVVDSGVDYRHPDLMANVWSAPQSFSVVIAGKTINCPAGSHGFNAITLACDPLDDNLHGTHVSGTIGAAGNNATGVSGVNWAAQIMGLKFLDASGNGSSSDAINAMEFAIQVKAQFASTATPVNVRVFSNSWGGTGFSQSLLDEVNRANTNNILFVAAAGNSSANNDTTAFYPADFLAPNVVAVAATDTSDNLASFSNYGHATVHLGAPGVSIYSTIPSASYAYYSGTSMATPHVSGAALLTLAACPTLTTAALKAALLSNVDPVPGLAGKTTTGGRLNVNKAIRSCATPPPVNTAPVVNAGSGQTITLTSVDPKMTSTTCASPAFSVSMAEPFTTTFSVTVKPGDTVLSVVDGYRAVGKTIGSIVFNGTEALTKSAGTLGNTMGAEIWSLRNPTATTANIVITYTNGGVFVFDKACARTFTGVDLPVQSSAAFTTGNASSGLSLTGLASTGDKAIFVDIAACNCGGLLMVPETNRILDMNAGPNQVGSSTIITKSPAGTDTMPWTLGAVQATEAGVVYPPLPSALTNLSGTATDDGLPNGTLITTWSEVSGPGTVTFGNANALSTTASFPTIGTYFLRLTANDSALSSTSNLTIVVVASGANTAPVVNAGSGQTITLTSVDSKMTSTTCASPAFSVSVAEPFTTTFSVTVKPGDTVLSVVDGYRAVGKTIGSIVFNGTEALTKSAGTLGNTMGAEIWSLRNPTATTANIVITYTNGGVFVFDKACARTFTGVDLPVQSSAAFTTGNASSGLSLTGLASTGDKAIFVDIAACNCGGLLMVPETNRILDMNAGPNQVGSSTIITKSPAGTDTMPWTLGAVQATEAGVVYPPLPSALTNLSGTATDDGLPNGTLITTWSEVSGPGTVTFGNTNALSTTASFPTIGTYVLRLTANDSALSSTSNLTIVVVASGANTAPVVNAGSGQTITLTSVDPKMTSTTCASPAFSVSVAEPFTTTFSVTVKPGDTVLSVVDGYRAVGKTIGSIVFNGSEVLTKSAGTLGNTMGVEIWSLRNPTATTANIVITYTNGGVFVFDKACARTFTGVDLPVQSSAAFTTGNASSGLSLTGLASAGDKAIFVDVAACNCGGLLMVPETNRILDMNAGPNQVGSSTIITKSPAGADTMPWTTPAVQATEAGAVYPPLPNALTNLSGTAADDGLPNGTLITTWSEVSGPGTVTFGNTNALSTTASFPTIGTYVLRLTANDSALSSTSDLTIVVVP